MKIINHESGKASTAVIILCVLVGILIIAVLFSGGSSQQGSTAVQQSAIEPTKQTKQTQPSVVVQTKNVDVNIKSKCANDGQTFYTNFQKKMGKPELVWWDPQFHFDAVLNTCLMYIQWNDASIPVVFNSGGADYIQTIMNNNVVFDIYSNQAILQNEITRKSVSTNGEVQTTSGLNNWPLYQNIPNSDVDTFIAKLKVLMSE
ncbi:MAG: hypothetical protein NT077_04685 [Candidatus Taylorbacteria bacterium]|nr:hypothetical protein [Candidatus Taylorbacteria bacterium]